MRVSTTFGKPLPEHIRELDPSRRFRVLVLADLGGVTPWGRPVAVDRDDLDDVFQQLKVRFQLPGDSNTPPLEIELNELDDFHPDRLFEKVDWFNSLRTRRRRLQNDKTFAEEAEAILAAGAEDSAPGAEEEPDGSKPDVKQETSVDPADLLSQALEQTELAGGSAAEQIAREALSIDDYVRRVVAPYVVDKADPRKAELTDAVDEAIAGTMRRLLHHPSFQRLEAAWLGVQMLVRRLETDSSLKISLVNVSKQQLAEDVLADDDLTKSQLHKLLVDSASAAGDPWTIVVGDYRFDASAEDTSLLGRVAQVHSAAGAVFIAGGSPSIVGCPDLTTTPDPRDWIAPGDDSAERWQALRELPASAHAALTLPRVLARLPYGGRSQAADSFRFEEMPDGNAHEDYLWMNSAFAVATLLGRSFSLGGWSLDKAWSPELDGLPMYVYSDDGESVLKPCGETELSLPAGEVLAKAGLTVVHSVRQQGSVLIRQLRSLSLSQDAVAGAWE